MGVARLGLGSVLWSAYCDEVYGKPCMFACAIPKQMSAVIETTAATSSHDPHKMVTFDMHGSMNFCWRIRESGLEYIHCTV